MNKYVILHNIHDEISRNFVSSYGTGKQVIDWYSNSADVQEYCVKEMPSPTAFPCVVDTEKKIIINSAVNWDDSILSIDSYISKERYLKLCTLRQDRNYRLISVDVMINELALGLRTDSAAIISYRNALLSITDAYKDEEGNATSAVDALNFETFEWPVKP